MFVLLVHIHDVEGNGILIQLVGHMHVVVPPNMYSIYGVVKF